MEFRVGFVSFGLPLMAIGSFIAGYAATIPSPPLCQEQCSAEVANSALVANEYIMRLTTYGLLITLLGFAVIVVKLSEVDDFISQVIARFPIDLEHDLVRLECHSRASYTLK